MATILTLTEAATMLRCEETDPTLADLLPQVDAYINLATGRNWALDNPVRPEAKSAARMLLVREHEDPGGLASAGALSYGLSAKLAQLEALALMLETDGIPGQAMALATSMPASGQAEVATTVRPLLIFTNPLATGEYAKVSLKLGGITVAITTAEDVSGKSLWLIPSVPLFAAAEYRIVIEAAADIYGQTLSTEIRFRTA